MSKVVGIDLGTTNSLVAYVKDGVAGRDPRPERRRAACPRSCRSAEDGTVYVGREAQRRLLTDAGAHGLFGQALHGQGRRRRRRRGAAVPVPRRRGDAGGVVRIGLGEREFTPPEISAFILRELKRRAEAFFAAAGRRRSRGRSRRHHRAGLLQRRAAHGDARRRPHRRPRGAAHHQRADRGVARLRPRQAPRRPHRRLRLRRRHVRHLDPARRGRRLPGARRPTATRTSAATTSTCCSSMQVLAELDARRAGSDAASGFGRRAETVQRRFARPSSRPSGICPSATRRELASATRRTHARRVRGADPARSSTARSSRAARRSPTPSSQPSQIDEVVLVGGSTRIPLVRRLVGELFGRTPHSELNPDEVVALGAAVQADILVTGNREMLLLDVTPLSLGIETMGGVMSKIILRNSTIPATGSEMFTTGVDNQTAVDIHVLQGERELVADNRSLGALQAARHPADARRHAARPGAVPDRRQRHPERHRARAAHRRRADDRGEAVVRPDRRRGRAHAARLVRARRGRLRRAAAHRGAQRGRDGRPRHREVAARAGVRRDCRGPSSAPGEQRADRAGARRPQGASSTATDREAIQQGTQRAERRDPAPGRSR